MKKRTKEQFRHGDLLFLPINNIPERVKRVDSDILVRGEASSHVHRFREGSQFTVFHSIPSSYFRQPTTIYVEIIAPSVIEHIDEETGEKADHDSLEIPVGLYEVRQQIEIDPMNQHDRRVFD